MSVSGRVCPIFMQKWISEPPNREKLSNTLGGPIDGVLVEYRYFPGFGVSVVPDYLTDTEAATFPCATLTA